VHNTQVGKKVTQVVLNFFCAQDVSGPPGIIPGEMASVKEEVRTCLFIQLKILFPTPFSTPPLRMASA